MYSTATIKIWSYSLCMTNRGRLTKYSHSSSKKIYDIISKLVKKKYPMFDPAHDVVSMETTSKTDIMCLLGFRVSYIDEVIGVGENWDVHILIRSSHITNPVRVANPFQRMMAAAISTSMEIPYVYSAAEINNILSEYHSSNNIKQFLQSFTTLEKPNFNDQVRYLLSDYLWRNNVGY